MNQLDEQKKVEALRQRLYSRGEKFDDIERRDIGDVAVDVSRNWNLPQPKTEDVADYRHSRRYRWFVLIGSFLFLLLTAVATKFLARILVSTSRLPLHLAVANALMRRLALPIKTLWRLNQSL